MKPATDRLSSTLFVAALFHGLVILGVTFTGPHGDTAAIPTLKVTLLADSDAPDTDSVDADYLAQRSSTGGGRRASGDRPTTTPARGAAGRDPARARRDGGGASDRDRTHSKPLPPDPRSAARSARDAAGGAA